MKTQLQRHLIIIMTLLLGFAAWPLTTFAQDRAFSDSNWSGSIGGGTVNRSRIVTIVGDVTLNGQIIVGKGATLTIRTNGNWTIKRGTFGGFFIHAGGSDVKEIGHVDIDGGSYTLTLDGGAVFNTANDATSGLKTIPTYYGRAILCTGNLILKNVTLQNFYQEESQFIALMNAKGDYENTAYTCKMTNCTIQGFYGGCLLYVVGPDYHHVTLKGVTFCNNDLTKNPGESFGSCIRANGNTKSDVKLINCKILNNKVQMGTIHWNTAALSSTHFYIYGPESEFANNTSLGSGGAIFNCARMTISSADIHDNYATTIGGGIHAAGYTGGTLTGEGCSLIVSDSVKIRNNHAGDYGGGIYMQINPHRCIGFYGDAHTAVDAYFKLEVEGEISGNHAPVGGGVYIEDFAPDKIYQSGWGNSGWSGTYYREVNIKPGAKIYGNYTDAGTHSSTSYDQYGGAICIRKYKSTGSDETAYYNGTTNFGTLTVNITGGDIYQNTANAGNGSATYKGCGGALYLENSVPAGNTSNFNVTVSGSAQLFGNSAANKGAAIYIDRGNFTMTGGTIGKDGTTQVPGSSPAVYKTNHNVAADAGGGFYITGSDLSVSISGGTIQYNEASHGGGYYANGGTSSITGGNIQYNQATTDGGGIFANGGTTTVNYDSEAAGKIHHNYAGAKGGGLYIPDGGTLNLYGNSTLEYNRVPYGGQGGGAYVLGKVQAGHASESGDIIKVATNYADEDGAAITNLNRNNIYLPNPTVNANQKDVITVVDGGLDLDNSSIGFSVLDNFVPVIYCATTSYLNPTIKNSPAIFEDSHSYEKYYTNGSDGYDPNHIYLAADIWTMSQSSEPSTGFSVSGSNVTVSNAEGLAWLISYVNNLNGVTGDHTNVNVTLSADINMSAHKWVPIGYSGKAFRGTFDGGGHVITGLNCSYIKGTGGTGTELGLFGVTDGATIHDVTLVGADIMVRGQNSGTYSMGAIVNEAKNNTSIYNCIASSTMESTIPATTMGGLVGKLTSGTIHSSSAMPNMKGYKMGGIAGDNAGSIFNSFANAEFIEVSGDTQYMGGLVGVNTGRVENCYSRVRGTVPTGKFGYLVGNNTSATDMGLYYSYSTNSQYVSTAAGTTSGNQTELSTFGATQTPYLYKHADNQMSLSSGTYIENGAMGNDGEMKGLLATLNNWVTANSGHGYSTWMRTCASPINADYPLHKYTNAECVASKDNISLEYPTSFNTKFDDYVKANTGTILLYKTPAPLTTGSQENVNVSNHEKNTVLYIDEHVALKPISSKAAGDITATVGITLDNSAGSDGAHPTQGGTDAIDWHMFSTPLSDAPLGVDYNDDTEEWSFNWGTPPTDMPLYQLTNTGYFPSKEYGTNADYYYDWDYYAYFEPEYHWINFKRNGNSHWHEDDTDVKINYRSNGTGADWTNESTLIKGRGYLVATKEPAYLQCSGTLTKGNVSVPITANAWVKTGYNFLGNPYQAYLDFDAFAETNSGDGKIWDARANANYYILDEDQKGYVKYAYNASGNTYTAPRCLHPHQGFMVLTQGAATAEFTESMRITTATGVSFRGNETTQPAYPLVNLIATEGNGNRDVCTIELGRPDKGGAPVQRDMRISNGLIYCHYDDQDWGIAFTAPGITEVPVRFETTADGEFTLNWDTENGDFSYLHLLDNMTGADIDCLTTEEYRFAATTNDYASRFRLVFDYTGIEEGQENGPASAIETTFAFQMGDELVVNGEGTLQLFDLTGRLFMQTEVKGVQNTIQKPNVGTGVYLLRLSDQNGTRTQKIVIK